jgi:4-diphosphocytidyl-2-C-methyl-D-erythritol kinase
MMVSFPNAKINLGLHILAKREDGFHDIETVFYPVMCCDVLEIIPDKKSAEENSLVSFQLSGIKIFGDEKKNLCLRAYNLLSEKYSLPPIQMYLHKIIPIGAGLGGGSTDATFTLMMLNKIFDLKIDDEKLESYAAFLGSDCSFFIRNKPMFASGRGEVLEDVNINLSARTPSEKKYFITIVKPEINVSTAEAYSMLRLTPTSPKERGTPSLKKIIQMPVEMWKENLVNDFEKNIFKKYPAIEGVKNKLYESGAVYASMSGSGSAVFGIFKEEKKLSTEFPNANVWNGKL